MKAEEENIPTEEKTGALEKNSGSG